MVINCPIIQPLLSQFLDDDLDAQTAWQVQTHVAACEACAQTQRELSALRGALRALPAVGPSAGFDAALAQRLALTRRPADVPNWRARLSGLWNPPARVLRPALALGAAAGLAAGLLFLPPHTPPMSVAVVPPAVSQPVDHVFVADCVAQRRREAAGEPLADLSAQNLAGHLDAGASGAETDTPEADAATADAGVF